MIASKCRNWRALPPCQSKVLRYHAACWRLTPPLASKPISPSSMPCGRQTGFADLKLSSENSQPGFIDRTTRGEPGTSQ